MSDLIDGIDALSLSGETMKPFSELEKEFLILMPDADKRRYAKMMDTSVPLLTTPYSSILAAIRVGTLSMKVWHECATTHCLAGWVVHLAMDKGYALEKILSTPGAATLIIGKSRPDTVLPNFHAGNEAAREFIKARASEEMATKCLSIRG